MSEVKVVKSFVGQKEDIVFNSVADRVPGEFMVDGGDEDGR
jgi:hypothetical protein